VDKVTGAALGRSTWGQLRVAHAARVAPSNLAFRDVQAVRVVRRVYVISWQGGIRERQQRAVLLLWELPAYVQAASASARWHPNAAKRAASESSIPPLRPKRWRGALRTLCCVPRHLSGWPRHGSAADFVQCLSRRARNRASLMAVLSCPSVHATPLPALGHHWRSLYYLLKGVRSRMRSGAEL
jgi:hypothetical protein